MLKNPFCHHEETGSGIPVRWIINNNFHFYGPHMVIIFINALKKCVLRMRKFLNGYIWGWVHQEKAITMYCRPYHVVIPKSTILPHCHSHHVCRTFQTLVARTWGNTIISHDEVTAAKDERRRRCCKSRSRKLNQIGNSVADRIYVMCIFREIWIFQHICPPHFIQMSLCPHRLPSE